MCLFSVCHILFSVYRPYIYVRLFYAFSIFATYFVQLYVPLAIVHRKIIKYSGRLERFAPYFVRVVFVGITGTYRMSAPLKPWPYIRNAAAFLDILDVK